MPRLGGKCLSYLLLVVVSVAAARPAAVLGAVRAGAEQHGLGPRDGARLDAVEVSKLVCWEPGTLVVLDYRYGEVSVESGFILELITTALRSRFPKTQDKDAVARDNIQNVY